MLFFHVISSFSMHSLHAWLWSCTMVECWQSAIQYQSTFGFSQSKREIFHPKNLNWVYNCIFEYDFDEFLWSYHISQWEWLMLGHHKNLSSETSFIISVPSSSPTVVRWLIARKPNCNNPETRNKWSKATKEMSGVIRRFCLYGKKGYWKDVISKKK